MINELESAHQGAIRHAVRNEAATRELQEHCSNFRRKLKPCLLLHRRTVFLEEEIGAQTRLSERDGRQVPAKELLQCRKRLMEKKKTRDAMNTQIYEEASDWIVKNREGQP